MKAYRSVHIRRLLSLGVGLCLSGNILPANAQSGGAGPQITNPGAEIPEVTASYKLGPQDALKVVVEGHPEYSDEEVIVPPDGLVVLPTGFTQQVIGKTKQDVQNGYKNWLGKKRLRSPQVSVSIKRMRPASSGYVYVTGDVVAPGTVDIRKGFRITEVLARVGGVKGRVDEAEATIARRTGKKVIPVDLAAVRDTPLSKANIEVLAGDVLTVRILDPGIVSVNGDVKQPGIYQMRKAPRPGQNEIKIASRLSDLLVVSGLSGGGGAPGGAGASNAGVEKVGLTAPGAVGTQTPGATLDPNDINYTGFLMRKIGPGQEQKIPLNVVDALKNPGSGADISLKPGDFVTIEAIPPLNVWVNGFVGSPSKIKLTRGAGVIEALAQAGGLTRSMDKVTASIIRNRQVIPVNLENLPQDNPPLQDEDVLQFQEPNVIRVQVTGPVLKPSGPEPLRLAPGAKVLDAITQAGGLTGTADMVTINVLRTMPNGRQNVLKIDPVSLINRNDETQNARLQDGDLVTVAPTRKQVVYLIGQVNRPSSYELREGQGLVQLIADAGGVTPTAALTRVTVQRQGESHVIDIFDAVNNGAQVNFPLQNGDMVTVPPNENRILVVEAVNKPGYVPIPEKRTLTLLDAVNMAGGPQAGARTQEVLLLRQTPQGKVEQRVIKYNEITQKGNVGANLALQHGDIVAVPPGKVSGSFINKVSPALGLFGLGKALFGF